MDGQILLAWGRRLRRPGPLAGLYRNRHGAAAGFEDLLAIRADAFFDNDEDGLNDHWELLFGVSRFEAAGDGGPDGDPDHDGVTNAQELAGGSNPVGTQKHFLAEGTSSPDFFSTRIAIVNPGSVDAKVAVRFDAGDGAGNSGPWSCRRARA